MPESIRASADRLAKAETQTTITVEGTKTDATASVTSAHDGERVSWSLTAWVKRKFQKGGTSGGVKGEVSF